MPDAFPQYRVLANGFTDRIFLLGHGPTIDGDNISNSLYLNDPYQVVDIREAVNKLQANSDCPLLKGLLELYYGGARDIFLMAVAPMLEYQSDVNNRDHSWYNTYRTRLNTAYNLLLDWDLPQIIIPLNAPYYDAKGVDFLTPLANHCGRAFDQVGSTANDPNSGNIRLGFMGTSFGAASDTITSILSTDPRLASVGDDGKFVSIIVGEGVVNIREMPTLYTAPLVISAAAELSQLSFNKSLTYTKLRNVMNLVSRFSKNQLDQLTQAKLNPITSTTLGLRGRAFESVVLTDNTLGIDGSDYWSLVQIRLAGYIIDRIRSMGRRHLGDVGFGQFKQDVQIFFAGLITSNYVKDCTISVNKGSSDIVLVDVSFTPYFGLRQISFTVNVGPAN
jgi:hypothetical protein